MKQFQDKKRYHKLIYSKGTLIALILFLGVMLRSLHDLYQKNEYTNHAKDIASQELAHKESQKKSLEQSLAILETDEGKDAYVRVKHNVQKEGEETIVVVREEATTTSVKERTVFQIMRDFLW